MEHSDEDLNQWARDRIRTVHRWAIFYWTLHNWCALLSWAIAIAVPFGLAVTLYSDQVNSRAWNLGLLVASGLGLILQVLGAVMRFKERAVRGRRICAQLEASLLKFQHGSITKPEFLHDIQVFLAEDYQEEGP